MVQGASIAQQRSQLAALEAVLSSDAPKRHDGIPCGLTQCRMDAPLPCQAGGGAEAVTPGLVTVSLGKRPMQHADTWQGTSRQRRAGGCLAVSCPRGIFRRNSDRVIPKA